MALPLTPLDETAKVDSHDEADVYDDGYLRVEFEHYYIACAGRPIYELTRKEIYVFLRLVRECGRAVPHAELWSSAWDANAPFSETRLKTLVSSLRRKVEPYGLEITALVGVGYRLISTPQNARNFNETHRKQG